MLGFLTGAVLFGLTYQQVFPLVTKVANLGNVVVPDPWNLNPFLVVLLFALIAGLLFYLIDRGLIRKDRLSSTE